MKAMMRFRDVGWVGYGMGTPGLEHPWVTLNPTVAGWVDYMNDLNPEPPTQIRRQFFVGSSMSNPWVNPLNYLYFQKIVIKELVRCRSRYDMTSMIHQYLNMHNWPIYPDSSIR